MEHRTDQHEILGSPRYMSPEQIDSSRDVDHRTDIWSLGVILHEAICGTPPFNAETVPELWRRIRCETPPDLRRLRPDCPAVLADAVTKCLQKEPDKRFPDLGAFATALTSVAPERSRASIARIQWTMIPANVGATRPSAFACELEQATTARENTGRRWFPIVAVAVAAVLALGVVGKNALRGDFALTSSAGGALPSSAPAQAKAEIGVVAEAEPSVTPVATGAKDVSAFDRTSLEARPMTSAVTRAPGSVARSLVPKLGAIAKGATPATDSAPAVSSGQPATPINDAPTTESPPWRVPPIDRRK